MTPPDARRTRLAAWRRTLPGIAARQVAEVRAAVTGLGRLQAALLLGGASTVAYGGLQLLQLLLDGSAPALGVAGWWLGGPLVVDLIAVPLVVVAGVGIGRIVPPAWRRYVSAASVLTVLVSLVAFPFLTGAGRRPDNASLLDRNYWAGYLVLVMFIWTLPLLLRLWKRPVWRNFHRQRGKIRRSGESVR